MNMMMHRKRLKSMAIGVAALLLAALGVLAWHVDDWSRDLTTNRAETDPAASDPQLRPLRVAASLDRVETAVAEFADSRSNWAMASTEQDGDALQIDLERTTHWLRFTDDVRVSVVDNGQACVIRVVSQSRVGRGDLGQNPRNIRELMTGLLERLRAAEGEPSD